MKKIIVGIAGLSLLLVGCSSGSQNERNQESSASSESSGSATSALLDTSLPYSDDQQCSSDDARTDATFGIHAEQSGMDPASPSHPAASSQLAAIYSTLFTYDYDANEFAPEMAQAIESNDDNTEWTLSLRDDVTFSSGEVMDADVVKTSIERFTSDDYTGFLKTEASLVDKIDVLDETTIKFTLNEPWGAFPYFLSRNAGMIVNPTALERVGEEEFDAHTPEDAGAGAFVLKEFTPGQETILTGKTDWWGGPVCIETLNIPLMADSQVALDSLEAGQIDAFQTFVAPVVRKVRDSEDLEQIVLPTYLTTPLAMNISGGSPMDNQEVRQAMQLGLDIEAVSERIHDGVSDTSRTIIPESMAGAPTVEGLGYDVEAATKLIAKQGDLDEMLHITNAVPMQENQMILINSMWKSIGLNMLDKTMPQNQLVQEIYVDRNFGVVSWASSLDPACVWCGLGGMVSTSPSNITGYDNPEMDTAIDQVRSAADPSETSEALNQVQTVWNETVPSPHMGFLPYTVPMQDSFHGLRLGAASMVTFDKVFVD